MNERFDRRTFLEAAGITALGVAGVGAGFIAEQQMTDRLVERVRQQDPDVTQGELNNAELSNEEGIVGLAGTLVIFGGGIAAVVGAGVAVAVVKEAFE